jgi:hypothetical protein
MRTPLLLLVAALNLCLAPISPVAQAAEWQTLPLVKDGKVDPAWTHIGYGGWVVEDGAIRTDPSPKGLGLLVYNKAKLGHCEIKVVFKTKELRSNSGVYVRIADGILDQVKKPGYPFERGADGKPTPESDKKAQEAADRDEGPWWAVHRGYEVQIAGDSPNGTGSLYSLAPAVNPPKGEPGQWRTMIITLDHSKVLVNLDGKPVTTFDANAKNLPAREIWYQPKREPKRPEHGYIGLQTHDPEDIVWFKEISVRHIEHH